MTIPLNVSEASNTSDTPEGAGTNIFGIATVLKDAPWKVVISVAVLLIIFFFFFFFETHYIHVSRVGLWYAIYQSGDGFKGRPVNRVPTRDYNPSKGSTKRKNIGCSSSSLYYSSAWTSACYTSGG